MNEDLAKKRFYALSLVRLFGLICVFAGIANIGGKILPELMPWLGYVLLVNGVADYFIIPVFLKRKWRTPDA